MRLSAPGCLLVLLVLLVGSCTNNGPSHPAEGNALHVAYGTQIGVTTSPPGQKWAYQFVWLKNVSDQPITVLSARLAGSGLGTVIAVDRMYISPLPNMDSRFVTFPPAYEVGNGQCWIDRLYPVRGYVLAPGGDGVRLLVLVRSIAAGHYKVVSHTVVYRQGAITYQQSFPVGPYGDVSASVPPLRPYPEERACIGKNGVRLMNP